MRRPLSRLLRNWLTWLMSLVLVDSLAIWFLKCNHRFYYRANCNDSIIAIKDMKTATQVRTTINPRKI